MLKNEKVKIALAQISPKLGDLKSNLEKHIKFIQLAIKEKADLVIFPELSLTGYEPQLAKSLAFTRDDSRLFPLIESAKTHQTTVVAGAPLSRNNLPELGAIIISPDDTVSTYAKIHLHPGEDVYFSAGQSHFVQPIAGQQVAIAICADTNQPQHAKACKDAGATVYAAGVLITENGYEADVAKLESYAKDHQMLVAMANHNRPTGEWIPAGKSAIWSPSCQIVAANENQTALLIAEKIGTEWRGELVEL